MNGLQMTSEAGIPRQMNSAGILFRIPRKCTKLSVDANPHGRILQNGRKAGSVYSGVRKQALNDLS